ncbi:O-antigen ligase family protein [Winogradskyella undariae]|uniref:O-antigen ligase family protein n=1 Tax=Winogradskyella undariae TaxID=1285465 RepID=UPI00211CED8D|nr:O-antigen ligase family protein [Winogradskyella undariae]
MDNKNYLIEVLKACAYFAGAEVFFRMTHGNIGYEAGKYLVILFSFIGLFYMGISNKAYPYLLYLLLLIPPIFVASTTLRFDANFRTNIFFVLSGPVCLGIASLFTYGKTIKLKQMLDILWFMVLPIISMTVYLILYTPSLKDVLDSTSSNVDASGGFGPNQVSTFLGLGVVILAMYFFLKPANYIKKLFYLVLMIAIGYRGLVTLSRGGIIAAIITIAVFLIGYLMFVNTKKRNKLSGLIIFFMGAVFCTWLLSSVLSGGYVDLRYSNKDHLGREKSDVSTGRVELFVDEIEGFIHNPFLGIGISRAKDSRIEEKGQGVISHNEISRILSEHGILGIIILGILIFKPLALRGGNKSNIFFYAFLAFWFATINHSGMRTALPAFIYALALLKIDHEKKRPLSRKQLIKQ